MTAKETKSDSLVKNGTKLVEPNPLVTNKNIFIIRLSVSRKLAFVIGLLIGHFVLNQEFVFNSVARLSKAVLDFEYDIYENCILKRKKDGDIEYCRPFIDCEMCVDVHKVDVFNATDMTP